MEKRQAFDASFAQGWVMPLPVRQRTRYRAFERVAVGEDHHGSHHLSPPPISSVQIGWSVGAGDPTLAPARTSANSPGQYRIGLTLPGTIPAQARLFVRLTHVDGAVVESGIEDFILPR
jgi:hypothetical protein